MCRIALMVVAATLAACANSHPATGPVVEQTAQMPPPTPVPPTTYNQADRFWPVSRIDEQQPWN